MGRHIQVNWPVTLEKPRADPLCSCSAWRARHNDVTNRRDLLRSDHYFLQARLFLVSFYSCNDDTQQGVYTVEPTRTKPCHEAQTGSQLVERALRFILLSLYTFPVVHFHFLPFLKFLFLTNHYSDDIFDSTYEYLQPFSWRCMIRRIKCETRHDRSFWL